MSLLLGPESARESWPEGQAGKARPGKGRVDYEKYLVREPVYLKGTAVTDAIKNPAPIYLSGDLVPGCRVYIDFGWIYGLPDPNPPIPEHSHDYEEIVLNIGGNPADPEDLGAEIEFGVEGRPVTFATTTASLCAPGRSARPAHLEEAGQAPPADAGHHRGRFARSGGAGRV